MQLKQFGQRLGTFLKKSLLFLLVCVFCFALIEGLCSTLLLVRDLLSQHGSPDRFYTRYDEELGWVGIPNLFFKDFYGPGINFKTNSQGFRNDEEFSVQVPPKRVRLICSGDSFTMGYGVDDNHPWPQLVVSIDNRFQAVNMGQAGYGVDQMYLWYRRDGRLLEHDIHIFAPVWLDFSRMQAKEAFGRGKPVLRVRNGELVVDNIPIPRRSALSFRLTQELGPISKLRAVELWGRILNRLNRFSGQGESTLPSSEQILPTADREVLRKMLEDLQITNRKKQSILIVVYLPTQSDYKPQIYSAVYRQFLREETAKMGVLFIDLVDDFQKLPEQDMEKLFIPPGDQYFATAVAGHYSIQGNEWVARKVYRRLVSLPEVGKKLALRDLG
jgi:hypothetical protein